MNDVKRGITSKIELTSEKNVNADTVVSHFFNACTKLEISIFEPYMQETDLFEDLSKAEFLSKYQRRFHSIKKQVGKDYSVERSQTVCTGCSTGKAVELFKYYSSHSKSQVVNLAFMIYFQNGNLIDIYECHSCKGGNEYPRF